MIRPKELRTKSLSTVIGWKVDGIVPRTYWVTHNPTLSEIVIRSDDPLTVKTLRHYLNMSDETINIDRFLRLVARLNGDKLPKRYYGDYEFKNKLTGKTVVITEDMRFRGDMDNILILLYGLFEFKLEPRKLLDA